MNEGPQRVAELIEWGARFDAENGRLLRTREAAHSLPRILHAWALAWLVALLVPRDAPWMHGLLLRAMAAIGRYSLEVFCLGLFLSWGATTLFTLIHERLLLDPLLIGLGSVLLALFARWLDRRRSARRIVVAA